MESAEVAVLYRKAADYCAASEHCVSEVRLKLSLWQVDQEDAETIILRLLKEGFIDESRYASAFARGKFRNLQWGKTKIRFELKRKNIPGAVISKAIEEIDSDEYLECIQDLMKKKMKSLGGNSLQNRLKVMRFLAAKGFEPGLIQGMIRED